jgi:hypothetical protein
VEKNLSNRRESILQKVIVEKIRQIVASQSIVKFHQNKSYKDNLDSTSMMESSENKNCGHCNNPGAVKKCSKSHTRCKEVRFCNKLCEKDAHTKKPTEKQPEDPNAIAEKLLKQEVEAQMKRNAKVERSNKRFANTPSNRWVALTKDALQWLEDQKKKK